MTEQKYPAEIIDTVQAARCVSGECPPYCTGEVTDDAE